MEGAGSVVREGFEVPAGTLAVGNPAANKGLLTNKAVEWVVGAAETYTRLAQRYRAIGRELPQEPSS